MSDEAPANTNDQIEITGFGASVKGNTQTLVRTISAVGTLVVMAGGIFYELTVSKPEMAKQWESAWKASDERHQAHIDDRDKAREAEANEQRRHYGQSVERITTTFDKAVERFDRALERLEPQRRVANSPAPPPMPTEVAQP